MVPTDSRAAGGALASAARLARALAKELGEEDLARSIARIEQAQRDGDSRQIAAVASGLRLYHQGMEAEGRGEGSAAEGLFRAAEAHLAGADSPFAAWAAYQVGVRLYHRDRCEDEARRQPRPARLAPKYCPP
jgi:hypothetical protein